MIASGAEMSVIFHVEGTEPGLWCPYCKLPSAVAASGVVLCPERFARVGAFRYVSCNSCGANLSDYSEEGA